MPAEAFDFGTPRTSGVTPNDDRDTRRSFWLLLRHAAAAAAFGHFVFLLLFVRLGLTWPIVANVVSVGTFVACWWLLGRRRNVLAGVLVTCEILLHGGGAAFLLGWDSGFQYYLFLLFSPMALVMKGSTASKFARLSALGLYFALLDAATRHAAPLYALDAGTLDALRYFNLACLVASMAFVSLTYASLVKRAERSLRALATTDPLTGLNNRRRMLEIAASRRCVAGRDATSLCVLLCDIDHFKAVNDQHGHDVGDRALQRVGSVLSGSLRGHDSVARWGGEEFLVLVLDGNFDTAVQTAERLRAAVAASAFDVASPGGQPVSLTVTVTIGVACVRAPEQIDSAIARADAALYRGKAAGRNCVAVEAPPKAEAPAATADPCQARTAAAH